MGHRVGDGLIARSITGAVAAALAITLFVIAPATASYAAQLTDGIQGDTYTVQAGDTLSAIARRAGVTVDDLIRANPQLDPEALPIGTVLRLPDPIANARPAVDMSPRAASPTPDPFALTPPTPSPASSTAGLSSSPVVARAPAVYIVQAGDSLNSIALRFATTPASLIDANGPAIAVRLQVGQSVLVPSTPTVSYAAMTSTSSMGMAPSMSGGPMGQGGAAMLGSSQPDAMASRLSSGAPIAPGFAGAPAAVTAAISAPASAASVPGRAAELTSASLPTAAMTGNAAVQIALQYTGSAYVFGGSNPGGFDCSGFVQFVMRQAGHEIPRDLYGQYTAGLHPTRSALEPGDLVFFQDTYDWGLSHVGIYIGNGNFIHAISEATGVGISSLGEAYYTERWYGATRLADSVK